MDRTTPRTIQDPRDDMPLERRRIIFTEAEIVSAALAYCKSSGIAVPDARVEAADVAIESDCSLTMTFAVTSPDQADEVRIDSETLLQALVSYCRIVAVPLPRAAAKRLEPMDGALSMVFHTDRARGSVSCSAAA